MTEPVTDAEVFDPAGNHTLEVIAKASRFNRWMYSEIKPFLKGNILEIGSGIGNISNFVIRDGYSITLSDYNPNYCSKLETSFGEVQNVKGILSIDLLHPNFETQNLPLKEKFDTIFLLNVIEHLKDDSIAVTNCRFLLKSEGTLILLAPAFNWLFCDLDKTLGHYRRYSRKKINRLLRNNGFEIIKTRYFNFLGIGGWFMFGKIFKRKLLGEEMSFFNKLIPLAKILDKAVFHSAGLSVTVRGKKKN